MKTGQAAESDNRWATFAGTYRVKMKNPEMPSVNDE
jgi:hypothetical protein